MLKVPTPLSDELEALIPARSHIEGRARRGTQAAAAGDQGVTRPGLVETQVVEGNGSGIDWGRRLGERFATGRRRIQIHLPGAGG